MQMRSAGPIPGNTWPHDMVISINPDETELLDLLWIRAAWGLQPVGDVPPELEIEPTPSQSVQFLRRDKRHWESAWSELWVAALGHRGRLRVRGRFDALFASAEGSDERRRLIETITGPSWRDRFGHDGFDEAHGHWLETVQRANLEEHRLPLEEHPERRSLPALIGAWERGLEQIITIPCAGDYTRSIGENCLCVTRATRFDPDRYSFALGRFRS